MNKSEEIESNLNRKQKCLLTNFKKFNQVTNICVIIPQPGAPRQMAAPPLEEDPYPRALHCAQQAFIAPPPFVFGKAPLQPRTGS